MARDKNRGARLSRRRRDKFQDDEGVHLEDPQPVIHMEFEGDEDASEMAFKQVPHAPEEVEERAPREPRRAADLDSMVVRHYVPKHRAPIRDIEFEVDHLHEARAGLRPGTLSKQERDLVPRRDRTVYRTERGQVKAAYAPSERGPKRALYVQDESALSERRFSSRLVDDIVKDVRLDEEETLRETVTEYVPKEEAKPKRRRVIKKKSVKRKTKKAKPAKKEAAPVVAEAPAPELAAKDAHAEGWDPDQAGRTAAADKEYQPQCAAITAAGVQCRNSARGGSKYCGSHKGFRPPSLSGVVAKRDTKPRVAKAEDTLPTKEGKKDSDHRPQCAALTAAGGQCRNSARGGSKYCASHKGFRPARIEKSLDTKPRTTKAEDTKPSLRKSTKRKSTKPTSTKRNSTKPTSTKRKSAKPTSTKRKSTKRQAKKK